MTEEDKPRWDQLRENKRICDEVIPKLEKLAEENPDNGSIGDVLAQVRRVRSKIAKVIPD